VRVSGDGLGVLLYLTRERSAIGAVGVGRERLLTLREKLIHHQIQPHLGARPGLRASTCGALAAHRRLSFPRPSTYTHSKDHRLAAPAGKAGVVGLDGIHRVCATLGPSTKSVSGWCVLAEWSVWLAVCSVSARTGAVKQMSSSVAQRGGKRGTRVACIWHAGGVKWAT
jgi:hypothetical protein